MSNITESGEILVALPTDARVGCGLAAVPKPVAWVVANDPNVIRKMCVEDYETLKKLNPGVELPPPFGVWHRKKPRTRRLK